MIYGPRLIGLHVPRTAGVFLWPILASWGLGRADRPPVGGRHVGLADLQTARAVGSRALLSTKRDPASWYASHYHYTLSTKRGADPTGWNGVLFRRSGSPKPWSFRRYLYAATHLHTLEGYETLRLPWPVVGPADPITRDAVLGGFGLFSTLYIRIAASHRYKVLRGDLPLSDVFDEVAFVDRSALPRAVPTALRALGVDFRPGLGPKIASKPKRNAVGTFGRGPRQYGDPFALYDDEMRGWIEQADGALMERFGYRFGVVKSTSPVDLPG